MEDMQSDPEYAALAGVLKSELSLTGSPVAIRLAGSEKEIPSGMEEAESEMRHCQMVSMARTDGRCFYAPVSKHTCMGGSWALGLRERTPSLASGEFYYALGKYESWAACRRTIDRIPHLPSGGTYATLYAPLESTPFAPHVVLIVAEPRPMLKMAQSLLYRLGGRIHAEMSGIQSVCSDATAMVYLNGDANISLGCDGSRKFSGIADGEMVMGLPAERLGEIADLLPIISGAKGSKK
ncbi:MAG: hypothetical protein D5R99_03920 [Methanocalculus sp. MSAO_Arc1]|uniref:DUF169 domain-containing protein n=1 Tax=Methanocalculus TaxID=71151 RepID=UPI000FEFD711|nr:MULTISPECIES: DUF169 domain-containing protein [unclassified Methanocalculus]MCP1662485.1 uncharacterized protein (DUF169 family) [Methanocalculus sp. AMF5]RQD80827.1 MAG: hypothetical protein D5R99_03920 [Methanocalculus sp. MSAO_Arc1]